MILIRDYAGTNEYEAWMINCIFKELQDLIDALSPKAI